MDVSNKQDFHLADLEVGRVIQTSVGPCRVAGFLRQNGIRHKVIAQPEAGLPGLPVRLVALDLKAIWLEGVEK